MPGSTWTSAATTSTPCSTRTPTTRCGSAMSSCARSRLTDSSACGRGSSATRTRPSAPAARGAWACPPPATQYDDTINDWHTCPESGRITTSNPCAEYLHLDNSSCNLASINLLKFLGEDSKTFDVQKFAKVCELVITAMD